MLVRLVGNEEIRFPRQSAQKGRGFKLTDHLQGNGVQPSLDAHDVHSGCLVHRINPVWKGW